MTPSSHATPARIPAGRALRGASLVELLVALGLGLALVSAALRGAWQWTREQRATHAHAVLHRTMTHTGHLLRQELRGLGHWNDAHTALKLPPATSTGPVVNPYAGLWIAADGRALTYGLDRPEGNTWFGFRRHPGNRTLDLRLVGGGLAPSDADQWQATTDAQQVRLDTLSLRAIDRSGSLLDACDTPVCPPGDTDCPPRWTRHGVEAQGLFRMSRDASIQRDWSVTAQARNLRVVGRCPG